MYVCLYVCMYVCMYIILICVGIPLSMCACMYVCIGCPSSIFLQMYRFLDLSGGQYNNNNMSNSERKPSVHFSLDMTHSEFSCVVLTTWLTIQVLFLFGQQKFGARFFIPAAFFPPKYNYRRPIPRHLFVTDNSHQVSSSTNSTATAASGSSSINSSGGGGSGTSPFWSTISRVVSGAREWLSPSSSGGRRERDVTMELRALLRDSEVGSGSGGVDDASAAAVECIICYTGIPRNSHTHMVSYADC